MKKSGMATICGSSIPMAPNPAVDSVRFAFWALRDKATQRRFPQRWASPFPHTIA